MELVDIILIIIIAGFAIAGFRFGLIHTIGSLLGTIFSVYIASRYYEPMADWIIRITGWGENFSRFLMFALAFVILGRLVGILFWFLEKFFHLITWLPFVKSLNRILGLIFGAFEGVLIIGIIVYFLERFPFSQRLLEILVQSEIAPWAGGVASILWPLFPEALRLLRSSVDYVEEVVRF